MRHIPEEELHAYLDQALSRSQCVEIERHLAECSRCRLERDEIAALRDRTTALLAGLDPSFQPPPFDLIRQRQEQRIALRRRRLTGAVWAASILLALAAGWQAHHWMLGSREAGVASSPPAPVVTASPVEVTGPLVPEQTGPVIAATPGQRPPRRVASAVARLATATPVPVVPGPVAERGSTMTARTIAVDQSPQVQLDTVALSRPVAGVTDPELGGAWRPLAVVEGDSLDDNGVSSVSGLPIVQVLVQEGGTAGEIMAVDQQLDSGERIRTITGPAAKVADLIAKGGVPVPTPTAPADTQPASSRSQGTLTLRQGNRMVAVTGPSDILSSLMSRVRIRRP